MKRTKKENLSSAGTSLSWLDDLQNAIIERKGEKSLEEYEADGWRSFDQIWASIKETGNNIGDNRLHKFLKKQIDDGSLEKIDVQVPLKSGKKGRAVLYRGK